MRGEGGALPDAVVVASPRKYALCAPEVVRIPEVVRTRHRTCGSRMKFAYRVSGALGRGSGRASKGSEDAGETSVVGISAACGKH